MFRYIDGSAAMFSALQLFDFKRDMTSKVEGKIINAINGEGITNAVVRVYKRNELIQTYNVPQNKRGTKWDVFAISKNGLITYNEVK